MFFIKGAPRSASKFGIDPNNSHASYFGKSTGTNKRSVPINRTLSSNWHQRVTQINIFVAHFQVQNRLAEGSPQQAAVHLPQCVFPKPEDLWVDGGRFDPETPECRRAQHDPRCQRRRPIPFARLGRATLARCDEKNTIL